MALIGPAPTVAFVHQLVNEKDGDELHEVLSEVIQFTDGPHLTNLASNSATRSKLLQYLTAEKLREHFPELHASSDPQFVALAWIADSDESLRSTILELISDEPQKESLTVLAKLLASGKLDAETQISDVLLDKVLSFIHSEPESHWRGLATLIAKTCCSSHKQYIVNYIRIHQNDALGFSAANAVFSEIPEVKDLVYAMKPSQKPAPAFFRLLSSLCNSKDDRLKVTQHFKQLIDDNSKIEQKNLLAMVVKAKLIAGQTSQTLTDINAAHAELDLLSQQFENNVCEDTLEGLVCTSMLLSVRKRAAEVAMPRKPTAGSRPPSESALKGPLALREKSDGNDAKPEPQSLIEGITENDNSKKDNSETKDVNNKDQPKKEQPTVSGAKDKGLIASLVELLKNDPSQMAFPVTAVLSQLAKYPVRRGADTKKALKLRQQAVGETVFDLDESKLETKEGLVEVLAISAAICSSVLDTGVIQWYTLNCTKLTVHTREQVALLLRELAAHQKRSLKQRLAVQGAAIVAMYLYTEKRPKPVAEQSRLFACSTLARILLSIEPSVAFTAKVSTAQAIPPLCDLINTAAGTESTVEELFADNNASNARITDLDTFEALLALTNLASIEDRPLRIAICRGAFGKLPACLSSDNRQIVRGALELVCNLMLVPQGAAHFLQNNTASQSLLTVLGKNLTCEDRASRLAASGALAMLAEWETAAEQIGRNAECIEGLSRCMGLYPDDDDMLVRVLTALKVIIKTTTDDLDDEVAERIIYYEGLAHMEQLVDTLDPMSHKEVGKLLLQCIHLLARYKLM